jgi:hypothetical protein
MLNPPKLCKVSFRYLLIHIINECVFSRHLGIYVFFNDFQFLVSHVHKFHIFVALFLISMSHVHVSNHIIYLYKVVPIKFVSLEVSRSY